MDLIIDEKYLRDQKRLLQHYFDTDVFLDDGDKYQLNIMKLAVEFIIRPECNQKCDYCYITKFGDDLYPNRLSKEETLKNLDLFLDYIIKEKKSYTHLWEIFAGDLMYDEIYFDILDLFDKYFSYILENYPSHFKKKRTTITMPTNLWWGNNEKLTNKFIEYYKFFDEKYNTKLNLSWSTDGLYCTDTRENKELTQEYFNKTKAFLDSIKCGMHPMVSSKNVKQWVDNNLEWWYEFLDNNFPMMLEVRNDDWTDESIEYFKQLLEKIFNIYLNDKFKGDISAFTNLLFNKEHVSGYVPIFLYQGLKKQHQHERTSCSMQAMLALNCTNLSMPICHRLAYPLFEGCQFILNEEKNKIIDYKPHNIDAYFAAKFIKNMNQPGCINCTFRQICMKGCQGAQYESNGDLFMRCETVCKFFTEKYTKIFELYYNHGIFEEAIKQNLFDEEQKATVLEILNKLGYEGYGPKTGREE